MITEREKNRHEKIQQARLRKEMQEQFNELNKLVGQIDFTKLGENRDSIHTDVQSVQVKTLN